MLAKKPIAAHWFQVDQSGIDELKNRCYSEAQEFSCFRKGAWTGIESSIEAARRWATGHPEWSASPHAPYPAAEELIQDIARAARATPSLVRTFYAGTGTPKTVCRRVICASHVSKARIAEWEAVCCLGSVATIPRSQVGPFSYVLNERMWGIFTRFGPDDLRGVMGTDRDTILTLRERFDREFIAARIRNQRRKR